MRNAALVSMLLAGALGGCFPDEDQAATLFNGTFPGQTSYAATVAGNGQGFAGAAPLTVTDDGDSSMQLGPGCTLGFDDIMLATDSRGQGTSATAMLWGSGCEVPVDGGYATFDVTSGEATSTGGTSLAVSLGGELASWHGGSAAGYVTVMFQGSWTHN